MKYIAIPLILALVMVLLPRQEEQKTEVSFALMSADALAERLLSADISYTLFDIRSQPTEMLPHADVFSMAALKHVPTSFDVILYGSDTREAEQYLNEHKLTRPCFILDGGTTAWAAQVLHVEAPADDARQETWQNYNKRQARANYFNGTEHTQPERKQSRPRKRILHLEAGPADADEGC